MESTPLSTRRITRSLASAASAQKSAIQPQPRAALHDITNDSPIVGLAEGGLVVAHADRTPQSSTAGAKSTRARPQRTPGSGEVLLRGQVKTLLHKVDEEAIRPVRIQALLGVSRSPAQLLAPTPANTPQLGTESAAMEDIMMSEGLIPMLQVIAGSLPSPPAAVEENLLESQLSRALVFDDSPGKSVSTDDGSVVSSSMALQGSRSDISPDDDSSSVWSIQVNVGSEEEVSEDTMGQLEEGYITEEVLEEEEYNTDEDWEDEDDDDDGSCFDELCEGMSKMAVVDHQKEDEERKAGLPEFEGTHTRFVYNSDDDIVERKEVANAAAEHDALLRGLPVPEGKQLRFQDDDDDDE